MAIPQVTVAGHACIDIVPQLHGKPEVSPGALAEIGPVMLAAGGCVANTARVLRDLRVAVAVVAAVGDDDLGDVLLAKLEQIGLDIRGVRTSKVAGTSYSIVLEPVGADRTFWHHVGANAVFDPADIDPTGSDILHLGYLQLLPRLLAKRGASLADVLSSAHRVGTTTSLDFAVVPESSPLSTAEWEAILRLTLPHVDVLSPSADDLRSMFGPSLLRTRTDFAAVAQSLLEYGAGVVAITAGSEGLYLRASSRARLEQAGACLAKLGATWANANLWMPASPVSTGSTTGAGDAASAALLHGILRGWGPEQVAGWAVAVAAAKVSGQPVGNMLAAGLPSPPTRSLAPEHRGDGRRSREERS